MKKNLLFITLLLLALLTSCNKKESSNEPETPQIDITNAKFIGSYSLSIDYIFVGGDGEAPSSGSWTGSMEITANGDKNVNVTSQIEIKDGIFLDLYHTTGSVNAEGKLVLDPYTYDNGSMTFDITFTPFAYTEPLRFDSEMYTEVYGYPTTYTITNVARKKQ